MENSKIYRKQEANLYLTPRLGLCAKAIGGQVSAIAITAMKIILASI